MRKCMCLIVTATAFGVCAIPARAFDVAKNLDEGWRARVNLAGELVTGASRTSSVSFALDLQYRKGRFESQLDLRLRQSKTRLEVARTDANGETIVDADGVEITDRVTERTSDRRFVSLEPRWHVMNERVYLFGLLDADRDRPVGVHLSLRQVVGFGYQLWEDKNNFLAAGVGVGRKRLVTTDDERDDSSIGYFGVKLALDTSERTKLRSELDSDFGGSNDFTEFSLSFGVELSELVSLTLAFEARVSSGLDDADDNKVDDLDSRSVVGLEIDLP